MSNHVEIYRLTEVILFCSNIKRCLLYQVKAKTIIAKTTARIMRMMSQLVFVFRVRITSMLSVKFYQISTFIIYSGMFEECITTIDK